MNSKPYIPLMRGEEPPTQGCGPSRESHVEGELVHLNRVIEVLEKGIEDLSNRLDSVLRVEPELQKGKTLSSDPCDMIVPLAVRIRNVRSNVQSSVNALNDITRRIEL